MPNAMESLDAATVELVALAAVIAIGTESDVRSAFADRVDAVPHEWVDELLVQSYLFCGFPRALNAASAWRRLAPIAAVSAAEVNVSSLQTVSERGEATCATVYGPMYAQLRGNIRDLHPALDRAMIVNGYGSVLSRPGLDLARRELCIVAACAATEQERQLDSHLHGALNVGVTPAVLAASIDTLTVVIGEHRVQRATVAARTDRGLGNL